MRKLSDKARAFLLEKRFAIVATIGSDGMPQQTVVWYELRDDHIMMNTRAGRVKEKNLGRDPRLSFCVADEYAYVRIAGPVELDYEQERAQADIRALAVRYHGQERGEKQASDSFSMQRRITILLRIDNVEEYGL